ncbi:hypothetical protein CLOSCI_03348 [[Clostridium] scindens ATCC 35704]|nr:hypothetical protein CLOSCI_03348 [[Clostridium] scindens ATCC 35704]
MKINVPQHLLHSASENRVSTYLFTISDASNQVEWIDIPMSINIVIIAFFI